MMFKLDLLDRPGRTLVALLLMVAGGMMLIDWLVVTEEEQIETMILEARDRFIAGDLPGFTRHLSDDFQNLHVPRERIEHMIENRRFASANVRVGHIELIDGTPLRASVRISVNAREQAGQEQRVMPKLRLVKNGERWQITEMSF